MSSLNAGKLSRDFGFSRSWRNQHAVCTYWVDPSLGRPQCRGLVNLGQHSHHCPTRNCVLGGFESEGRVAYYRL